MKKIVALLLPLCMILSLSACGRDYTAPDGFKQASNDEYCDYVLYVPSAWNTESAASNLTTASIPVGESGLTVSVAKLETRYADAEGNPINTVQDYWESCKGDYDYLINSTADQAKGEAVTLGTGLEDAKKTGYRYVFSGDYGTTGYTFAQVFVLNGGDLYCITMTVKTAHYTEETMTSFNEILSYFAFK